MTQFISRLNKINFIAFSFGLLAFSFTTANAQQVISLQKAVDLTLANNLTIKQSQITEALATEDYKQSKYNMLPSVSANPQGGYYFGKTQIAGQLAYASSTLNINGSVQANFTLFQGRQLHNRILENKLLLDADKTATAKVKNDLLLNVVTDYLAILTDQDLVVAAKQQIDLAKITLDRAQKNYDQGNATRADLAQAQSQLSTAELNLTTAQNQVDLAILILKQYMEMDPATDITVEKPDISKLTDIKPNYNASEVIKIAFGTNPDIKLAEIQQEGYKQAIKVAQGGYFPTLSLYGGTGSSYSNQVPLTFYNQFFNTNYNQFFGLNLQIPIFNQFTTRTTVRKAKLNYEYAEVTTRLAKNTLSKTIIQAELDLQAAEKSYQSALQTFESNKEALNVTRQRYDAGFVNTLDYNTAVTNYNKSQNDMINAQYNMIFRSKVIDYYLGNQITL